MNTVMDMNKLLEESDRISYLLSRTGYWCHNRRGLTYFEGFPFIIIWAVFMKLIKLGMAEKLVDGLE